MALHANAASLTIEAVEEYLLTARLCIDYEKENGDCLGYSGTLLLFCVIEVMGTYVIKKKKEPFQVLNHPCFGLKLDDTTQIKKLEKWYRNPLAHNGMIVPGVCLTPESTGEPFEFSKSGEPTKIRVKPFYNLVAGAWERFDKGRIDPTRKQAQNPKISNPIPLSGSSDIPSASSAAHYDPKITKF